MNGYYERSSHIKNIYFHIKISVIFYIDVQVTIEILASVYEEEYGTRSAVLARAGLDKHQLSRSLRSQTLRNGRRAVRGASERVAREVTG